MLSVIYIFVEFNEEFFNFAFVDGHLSINGRHWEPPQLSATPQWREVKPDYCTDSNCASATKVSANFNV